MKKFIGLGLIVFALSSCVTSQDTQDKLAKVYDVTCAAEPSIYATYVVIREGKGKTPVTGVTDAHVTITNLCANRPTDLVAASVVLAAAYAQIVAAK